MEVAGDENLPPSNHSFSTVTSPTNCTSPRSPKPLRTILSDVNTQEAKSNSESGSGEEEKCSEAEAWSERTAVITRYDHETHCHLARNFIEDIADKVVEKSLAAKKQQLFLPDLVPNVVIQPPQISPENISESDEYESADEQPLHDTLYLDSTVNVASTVNASTPIDCPGWHLDFDSSTVLPVADATVDASLKDYSLPVVEEEVSDSVEAIPNFCNSAIRSSQPFSPSSGSDVDVSVVESEADTLAALTPNNPSNEVDIDLISQFERLVLNKTVSAEEPITPTTLNTTFPASNNTPLDQTEAIEVASEALESLEIPSEQTESIIIISGQSETVEVNTTIEVVSSQAEVASEPLEVPSEQTGPLEVSSEQTESIVIISGQSETVEVNTTIEVIGTEVASGQTESVEVISERLETLEINSDSIEVNSLQTEVPSGITESVEVTSEQTETLEVNSSPTEVSSGQVESVEVSSEQTESKEVASANITREILPEDVEEKAAEENAPVEVEESVPVTEIQPTEAQEESEPPVNDSEPKNKPEEAQIVPAESTTNEVETVPADDESTVLSITEQTVLDSRAIDSKEEFEQELQTSRKPSLTLPEDKPIVPRKGYDLSFLDRFDNLENATPSISQPKLPPFINEEEASVANPEPEVTKEPEEPSKAVESTFLPEPEVLAQEESVPAEPEEPAIVPSKGYNLDFLDKLEDLEHATPNAVEMKESMSTNDDVAAPEAKPASCPAKKIIRKPIRPKVTRPEAFEAEFTFDPNEDPFKPKAKLGSSPPRDQASPSQQSDANTTITADDNSGNNTVIEDIPEQQQPRSSSGEQEESFRPAQEVFHDPSELDFLMQHGGSSHEIALARQSLFVKFDPLVGGRPSMFPSRTSETGADETILVEEKQQADRKSAGESLFLFSPPHPSTGSKIEKQEAVEHHREIPTASRMVDGDIVSLNEHKEALKLQELLFQDRLLQREREIQMKDHENQEMRGKLDSTVEAQAQMRQIVGEYEKTISQLIAEKEREKANMESTLQNTIKERDQAVEDLKEVERAFSEFHRMYERNRTAAENLHKNEEALKKALTAYQERLQQEQHKYETLKLHAAQKLEGAQQEMENMKRNLEGESSRVKAQLKKTEMRLASVETSLDQKTKENEELTKLCDELINKLGSGAK